MVYATYDFYLLIKYRYRIDIAIFWQYRIDIVSNSKNQYRCITTLHEARDYKLSYGENPASKRGMPPLRNRYFTVIN